MIKYHTLSKIHFLSSVQVFLVVVIVVAGGGGGGAVPSFKNWRSPIPMCIQWIPMKGPLKVPLGAAA